MSVEIPARRNHLAPREIARRLVVTGNLTLLTPAHLGNGDAEGIIDMPLLLDSAGEQPLPLLAGTSIAGALRGYLLSRVRGYRVGERRGASTLADLLLGGVKGDDTGEQSPLIVDDALGSLPEQAAIEVRDGVKIDYAAHTADDRFKYDLELLPAGTSFALRLELLLPPEPAEAQKLLQALALALAGLSPAGDSEHDEIAVGARRSRGFGRCVVTTWSFAEYELLDNVEGLLAWVAAAHSGWAPGPTRVWQGGPAAALGAGATEIPPDDLRRRFTIRARFALGPLLVRSTDPLLAADELPAGELALPDVTHLRSYRPGTGRAAVLPGTSLAGALRSRATMILATIAPAATQRRRALIDDLFGLDMHAGGNDDAAPTASRLIVDERPLDTGDLLVQSRVSLDRFTGGALDTALFSEAPWFGGAIELRLALRHDAIPDVDEQAEAQAGRERAQVGLLLLLLKDLWCGDLPVGGEASVGRGRMRGIAGELSANGETTWRLSEGEAGLLVEGRPTTELEAYVTALHSYLGAA